METLKSEIMNSKEDNMGSNDAPMFSPKTFEEIFLPVYKKMVGSLKRAGHGAWVVRIRK